jgi:hypothetical protein
MPTTPRARKRSSRLTVPARILADRLAIEKRARAYALPYYTRDGADTEYLISNPNPSHVSGVLAVFGKRCRIVKKLRVKLGPNCTQTFRIRSVVPEHAGHAILAVSAQIIGHILYMRRGDGVVVGGELAGDDNLFRRLPNEKSSTYGFGYRALPLGEGRLGGAVFVSNPNPTPLSGLIVFYDQRCKAVVRRRIAIKGGCTRAYPFPKGRFGYGRIQLADQAVMNVLHFVGRARTLAAAELLGEANRVEGPAETPQPRKRILFDDTHSCRPGAVGDWTDYESALTVAGYAVAHHTTTPLTLGALQRHDVFVIAMARSHYSTVEQQALVDFVNGGGGLMIVQDFGNGPWSVPTREILNLFGANDENNTALDDMHNDGANPPSVIFDSQRNFLPHPIVNPLGSFVVGATCTLSGRDGWATVVETDDDADPARRPVLLVRPWGSGRVLAFGDSNAWANHLIGAYENRLFGVRCAMWLLFGI